MSWVDRATLQYEPSHRRCHLRSQSSQALVVDRNIEEMRPPATSALVVYIQWFRWCNGAWARATLRRSAPHMFSNWSTRRLVLPLRISRRVLYLSRPCFTFSLWSLSMAVSLVSSFVTAKSFLRACDSNFNHSLTFSTWRNHCTLSWLWRRSFFSAKVWRSSTGSRIELMSLSEIKSRPSLTSPLWVSSSSPSS